MGVVAGSTLVNILCELLINNINIIEYFMFNLKPLSLYYCDICRGRQIPGLRWACSRKPKLKAVKGSEDIQDKDCQTQYTVSLSKG